MVGRSVGWGAVGYDTITAVFVPTLCELGWADGPVARSWFTRSEIDSYLSLVDDTFSSAGWGRPLRWLDELLVCRAISLCARRHPNDEVWAARGGMLRQVLRSFHAHTGVLASVT